MRLRSVAPQLLAPALGLLLVTASGGSFAAWAVEPTQGKEAPVLLGDVTREAVESFAADWIEAEVSAQPDLEAAKVLATVEPGAEVEVLFGSWCSDSRREIPRLWKALDLMSDQGGPPPFKLRYVAVDREKKQPETELSACGVRYLPTLIVRRNGREVGRIVETSPNGVEKDLGALLTGTVEGTLTTRTDLAAPTPAHPPV